MNTHQTGTTHQAGTNPAGWPSAEVDLSTHPEYAEAMREAPEAEGLPYAADPDSVCPGFEAGVLDTYRDGAWTIEITSEEQA